MSQSRPLVVVNPVPYNPNGLSAFVSETAALDPLTRRLLLDYPTVYVISSPTSDKFDVYVGETHSIKSRTQQHFKEQHNHWGDFRANQSSQLYVIAHEKFNKSLTLDIENRLMLYLSGVDAVNKLHNRRENPQLDYYTREDLDDAFSAIWRRLRKFSHELFPTERVVQQSALFKASPFHKLTQEQDTAKQEIEQAIRSALQAPETVGGKLILIEGAAGSGKTVLLSSVFFDLVQGEDESLPFEEQAVDAHLLVNHDEQETVYREIARKLGVLGKPERVGKPTRFINGRDSADKAEVVLVDEAHLLWTQGKQSYRGKNQMDDILERAKVVVAVFDPSQVMATNSYWEKEALDRLRARASQTIELQQQMRINSGPETLLWIRTLIDEGEILPKPTDATYDLRIFDSPTRMYQAIKKHAESEESGLSRLLATFDWPYSSKGRPQGRDYWSVDIDEITPQGVTVDFSVPWNREREYTGPRGRKKQLAWAEQPQTIDECGSHFTIQGFDLNYAGVILGPSVGYENGHVVLRPDRSANAHATQRRSMSDGSKRAVGDELLRNELNVLLTRGVNGLYIYAVDPDLRAALLKAQADAVPGIE